MGWPSTVNFSKDRRVAPALPRPAGVWAISKAGRIASAATVPIITTRFMAVSSPLIAILLGRGRALLRQRAKVDLGVRDAAGFVEIELEVVALAFKTSTDMVDRAH